VLQLASDVVKGITGSTSGLNKDLYVSLLLCITAQPYSAASA